MKRNGLYYLSLFLYFCPSNIHQWSVANHIAHRFCRTPQEYYVQIRAIRGDTLSAGRKHLLPQLLTANYSLLTANCPRRMH